MPQNAETIIYHNSNCGTSRKVLGMLRDAGLLLFEAPQVVARFEKLGDLFEPVLELKQRLPDLKAGAAAEPERIEIAAQADEKYPAAKKAGAKKKPAKRNSSRKSRRV